MPVNTSEFDLSKIPHNLLIKIQFSYDSLKTAEKKAADLMLRNPEFISKATIAEASKMADCSEATFTRLAQRLGLKGYPELKALLNEGKRITW